MLASGTTPVGTRWAESAPLGAQVLRKVNERSLGAKTRYCSKMAQRANSPSGPFLHALLAQGEDATDLRDRLATVLSVKPASIKRYVSDLGRKGLIDAESLRFTPHLGLVLGISYGTDCVRGALVDANGTRYAEYERYYLEDLLGAEPQAVMMRIARCAREVLDEGLNDPNLAVADDNLPLLGVAVAWPSPVDRSKRPRGRLLRHQGWHRTNSAGLTKTLLQHQSEALGKSFPVARCHAINDVGAHALTAAFTMTRSWFADKPDGRRRVLLTVRVGRQIGASTIVLAPKNPKHLSFIDSRLIEGTHGFAGLIGHLPIGRGFVEEVSEDSAPHLKPIEYDWPCSCGKVHHLEAIAGGTAIGRRLDDADLERTSNPKTRERILRSLHESDERPPQASAVYDAGRIVGRALTGPILMADPFHIKFTGAFANEVFVNGVKSERTRWLSSIDDSVQLSHFSFDESLWAGVSGAALAVLRQKIYRRALDVAEPPPEVIAFGRSDLERMIASTPASALR